MLRKDIIGQVETICFKELDFSCISARIDTGAKTSAIWVSKAEATKDQLEVIFFDKTSPHYTGKKVTFNAFSKAVVASSNGHTQQRYKVHLLVNIGERKIRAWFTLADRSQQTYPVLIGRNVLRGKFIVDITQESGRQIRKENKRSRELRQNLQGSTS